MLYYLNITVVLFEHYMSCLLRLCELPLLFIFVNSTVYMYETPVVFIVYAYK